ncbi:MAG: DUF3299 domain-containing protein [Comamonadaceae bacterium]|nr:DUF3299 domain-containing protein [Comamonadaceae bacterium]
MKRPSPLSRLVSARLLCLVVAGCLGLPAAAVAAGKDNAAPPAAKASQGKAASGKPLAVSWDSLVPPNWDPSAEFADLFADGAEEWDDSDPRAQKLYDRMRKVWDSAPTVNDYQGKLVRLPGYVVALEDGKDGLRELLLVPNFGACIHTPPPPANQIIHIKLDKPVKGFASLDAVWATGELQVARQNSEMGVSGYSLRNVRLEPYKE